ncbi:S-layer protein [Secundilactobacillus yichangensis]|uniref:S-layer protein n=1 Tax=Secundilactobacillus yichangensis TaxID=2799580 RepID=UPI001940B4C3|nr:S-layer protein [Secundilactobacillus yichangensis]
MKSSLKKSLYLGLAAVSFAAVAGTTSANASAKTYATASAYSTLTAPSTSRNVNLTGANAIYTKPGTVKGAKLVATTTTAKKLNASTNGSSNFRAYGVKTTNRGSVYFKVVSFDGHYRGYVYGGKSTSTFAGGVTSYATTKDATAPSATATYTLTADTSATSNTLFYKVPAWSQYKLGRARANGTGSIISSTDTYKGATLTFNKAATTSREGETWYQIASATLANGAKTTDLNGAWVKASNVSNPKADPAATADNSIKITYLDASNNNAISGADKTFVYGGSDTKSGNSYTTQKNNAGQSLSDFAKAGVPSGYTATADLSSALTNAKFGGTVYVTVNKAATSKVSLYEGTTSGTTSVVQPFTTSTSNKLALTPTQQQALTGNANQVLSGTDLTNIAGLFNGQVLYSATKNSNNQYDTYTVNASATASANSGVKYGDTIKLVLVKGAAVDSLPSTTPAEQANSNFLN